MSDWPITYDDVLGARERIAPHLTPSPLRSYPALDEVLGMHLLVKHENLHPTNAFKVRNGTSALTALSEDERSRGVIAATRGNHGLGLAWAGRRLGVSVTLCVPVGNNPEKNRDLRAFGAEVIEHGRDYDESIGRMQEEIDRRGLVPVHSTNDAFVIAGAGTIALETVEQAALAGESIDAMVVSVGGGSQAVGSMTVLRERLPRALVVGVQAAGASAIHDSWHAGEPLEKDGADTFADGLATRMTYELTFPALREGLTDFITVTEQEIADAIRLFFEITGVTPEGAGAAGLAGLRKLDLTGTVAIVITGSNIDPGVLDSIG